MTVKTKQWLQAAGIRVARADAEKTRTAVREQTLSQQKELRQSAGANSARVAEEIRKIVLGKA